MRSRALLLALLLLPASRARSGDGEVRLLTDESIPRYLSRGLELARAHQWDKMVDVLQRVITGDPRVFPDLKPEVLHAAVHSEDGQIYYPARELCMKELAKLPPEGLAAYRAAYDGPARALFQQAEATSDLAARLAKYAEVYEKYLVSSVGDDALLNAANTNLLLGRHYEALALYRRLIDVYPNDTDLDMAMALCEAAYCAARIGDREHRDVLLERLASEHARAQLLIEGEKVPATAVWDHRVMKIGGTEGVPRDRDWPVAGGSAARSRPGADLPEDLPSVPFWSYRLEERDPRLEANFGSWQVHMHDREPSPKPDNLVEPNLVRPYPALRAVAADGVVFYKDYVELIARRIGSGTLVPLWIRYRPADDLDQQQDPGFRFPLDYVRPGTASNPQGAGRLEDVYRSIDFGGNSVVADGDRLFVVETVSPPRYLTAGDSPTAGRHNLFVAYHRTEGKMLWGWDLDFVAASIRRDANALKEWTADFQRHQFPLFLGPGVVAGGLVYTLVQEQDELAGVSVWAFDKRDGRVRFRTQLHYPDELTHPIPVGASLAVAGGVVYVAPSSGVVAAVDALPPGRIRWIRRYDRNVEMPVRRANRVRFRAGPRQPGRIKQTFSYGDPIVTGGKVIVAPPDSMHLLALDAETGRLVWSHDRRAEDLKGANLVLGVSNGVVVLAGDRVTGLDLATGNKVWGPHKLEDWPDGRGFVGEKYAYVPTNTPRARGARIVRFDVKTGALAAPLEFDVERLGNLLSVDGRLVVANEERVSCFTTAEAERRRLDAQLAEVGERADLRIERALVALRVQPPERAAAREDLRRALAVAREPHERRIARTRALDNLLAMAWEGAADDTVDEARSIVAAMQAEEKDSALPFSQRPYEAQILLLEAVLTARAGRAEEALDLLEKFLDEHAGERVLLMKGNDTRDWRVTDAPAAARHVRESLLDTSAEFRRAFAKTVRERIAEARQRKDKEALASIPDRYAKRPPAEESYLALADLYEEEGNAANAELALRRMIRDFPDNAWRGDAHLRLALILARAGLAAEAGRERDEGLARLDKEGLDRVAAMLTQLERLLKVPGQAALLTTIETPLSAIPAKERAGAPVVIEGSLPEGLAGLTLLATPGGYAAVDASGAVVWRQDHPAGAGVSLGAPDDPGTTVTASAISAARLAAAVDGDLLIGDVYGLMRVDAATGTVRWRRPLPAEEAAAEATQMIAGLQEDVRVLERDGDLNRRSRLPLYAHAGQLVVCAHPLRGVEAYRLDSGEIAWRDPDAKGSPVGPPQIVGQLVCVGWASPGLARVYGLGDGGVVRNFPIANGDRSPGVLLAPPVLDPLGRLLLVVGSDAAATAGALQICNAREGNPDHQVAYPVHSAYATVLYADGQLVVFHDGSASGNNLHFIDLAKDAKEAETTAATGPMLREVSTIRDGYRLFVFSSKLGLADEGASLLRVDLRARDTLVYAQQARFRAYARPVLTRRYVVVAGAGSRNAMVQFYDREATAESRFPQPVYRGAGDELESKIAFDPGGETDYQVPPAIATAGTGIAVGNPFWTGHLRRGGAAGEDK